MKRAFASLIAAAALTVGLGPATAGADVHGVSQADCGNSPSAGATQSRDAPGRPDAPIPVSASDGRTQTKGDLADAQGVHCGIEE